MTQSTKLDRDLVKHACQKLHEAARRRVRGGMGPESAARAAIRETQALFPPGWKLGVQGDDDDDWVEVWEVEHKYGSPIATVRAGTPEPTIKLTASQRAALTTMILTPNVGRAAFPAAERRALAKLVEHGLATAYGDRYRATEAGVQAHYGDDRG